MKIMASVVGTLGSLKLAVATTLSVGIAALTTTAAVAQDFPNRPIKIVVPYAAGGGTDLAARLIGGKLTEAWKQPVVIENVPGAAGTLGATRVARSAPDGYTVGLVPNSHAITATIYPDIPYDARKDFTSISSVANYPYVLVVNPAMPIKSVADLIAYAKSKKGDMTYASSGIGTAGHLGFEVLTKANGISLVHAPYKGSSQALLDIVSGQVPVMFDPLSTTLGLVKDGKVRALAVSTAQRSSQLPDVPTVAEATGIKDFDVPGWLALIGPAGMPPAIVAKYQQELSRILRMPDVKEKLLAVGMDPWIMDADKLNPFVLSEIDRWGKAAKEANVTAAN